MDLTPLPTGTDVQVNTTTAGAQTYPSADHQIYSSVTALKTAASW